MANEQKRFVLAIFLSGAVLISWQMLFAPKKLETSQVSTPVANVKPLGDKISVGASTVQGNSRNVIEISGDKTRQVLGADKVSVDNILLSHRDTSYNITNNLSVTGGKSPLTVFDFNSIVGVEKPFTIQLIANGMLVDLSFVKQKSNFENIYTGLNTEYGISAKFEVIDDRLKVNLISDRKFNYRFVTYSKEKTLDNNQIRSFVYLGEDVERITVGDEDSGESSVKWIGLEFNFHLMAFVFPEKKLTRFKATTDGRFIVDTISPESNLDFYFVFSKKNYDLLEKLGDNLQLSVDFGIFGIVAVPILRGLQFLYKYFQNYGWAIIVLTIFIRMLTFPLQWKSFKSMKKMQVIQPEMAKLKEKFKDDPQRLQKETMALFKKAGANPLGGCLPMVAQMPIFIAFYSVLNNSVELVNQPFYFWLTDLSLKDPYYVLPILMGIVMVFQTKLNPSPSIDPTQKKIMMLMPVVFTFIMKDLPAGLNLYMTVSIAVGILQQLFVYKSTDA